MKLPTTERLQKLIDYAEALPNPNFEHFRLITLDKKEVQALAQCALDMRCLKVMLESDELMFAWKEVAERLGFQQEWNDMNDALDAIAGSE